MPTKQTTKTKKRTTRSAAAQTDTIKIKSKKGRKPRVTVLVDSEDAFKSQVSGFVSFLRERAIVGLAVGFVVATQVQGVVKQLIASFLDPLSKLLFGTKLSNQTFTLHLRDRSAEFGWGAFVYSLVTFLLIVASIYAIIKLFKLDKLDASKEKKK